MTHTLLEMNLVKVDLYQPPELRICFDLLSAAGAEYFCLFGGAVRDTDINQNTPDSKVHIKDYDLRVWFDDLKKASSFVQNLKKLIYPNSMVIEPCIGSDNIRYCFQWKDLEFDVSLRVVKTHDLVIHAVAQDRALKADIGLSAVAIDSSGQGWCRPEYLEDRKHKTLTVYPNKNEKQKELYVKRLLEKYPNYRVI
jgi:hypothetical protein